MTLSIIVPAYNEENNLASVLDSVTQVDLPYGVEKEIVIVDDGSTDGTVSQAQSFISAHPQMQINLVSHLVNRGKGAAIRTALPVVSGDYVVIQDADGELDPHDFIKMLKKIVAEDLPVIYGSRFLHDGGRQGSRFFYYGNRIISVLANILYRQHLTDEATCYKMFRTSLLRSLTLRCQGFEFCPEVTAKIARRGIKIQEVPINYYPRTREQGKKVRLRDGFIAAWCLLKYRFVD